METQQKLFMKPTDSNQEVAVEDVVLEQEKEEEPEQKEEPNTVNILPSIPTLWFLERG